MFRLLAVVVALILYVTLAPFAFHFSPHGNPLSIVLHSWPTRFDRAFFRDAVVNIALYLPMGSIACLAFVRRRGAVPALMAAIALGALLSLTVETLQVYDARRYASASDVALNAIGAALGATIALVYRRPIEATLATASRRSSSAALLLALCWAGAQAYPILPFLNFARLHAGISQFWGTHWSLVEVLAGAADWFVFGLALRALWGRVTSRWLAIAMFVLPAHLVIAERAMTKSELAAGALALLLWAGIADRAKHGAGWLLLAIAILLRELWPLDFTSPRHAFSWAPFAASIASERTASVVVLFRKAFEYGAMLWLLRLGKVRYTTGGIALAAALLVLEALQCWLPGKHPEVTDAFLALILMLTLKILNSAR